MGKEARVFQTWSIAGLLGAYEILRNPDHVELFAFKEGASAVACLLDEAEA